MTRIAVDSWAFLEMFFSGPRRSEVETALSRADELVTTRDVVAQTCNAIAERTGRAAIMSGWLNALRAGRTRIIDVPMAATEEFLRQSGPASMMSYAEASLASAASRNGIEDVASERASFREARLVPLFARVAPRR